jgi:hypothetical protein
MTEEEFSKWYDTARETSIRDRCFEGSNIDVYINEIRDLRSSLKYANATCHARLVKASLEEGHCPICGNRNLSDRKEKIP